MWKKQTSFQVTIRGQNVRRLSESVQNSLDHACYKRCLSSSFDISHLRNITYHVAPNQVKDATDEDFENIFQRAAFFQTLLKNFLEVTRS